MKLPNHELAQIPQAKITNNLLDTEHEEGGSKARFLQRFGFSNEHPNVLRDALLAHCAAYEVDNNEPFEYGTKYRISGPISSPDGRNPEVLVVWKVLTGQHIPSLVTVVPLRRRDRE